MLFSYGKIEIQVLQLIGLDTAASNKFCVVYAH